MAEEISIVYKKEQTSKTKLNTYKANPNKHYTLVRGMHTGNLLEFQLITDGDISSIDFRDTKGMNHYFYESPYNKQQLVQLKDNRILFVDLINATCVIKQGLCDGEIRYSDVNTQIFDDYKLGSIVDIANKKYTGNDFALTKEAPYVRKLILK